MKRLLMLAMACALVACAKTPPPSHEKVGAGVRADPVGPGYVFSGDGGQFSRALGPDTQSADAGTSMFLSGTCDAGPDASSNGTKACWSVIYSDQLVAPFAPTLAVHSGGTFEVGATCTPTFTANPATNSGTVTGSTIQDNQGNGPTSISLANDLNAPSGGGHNYALSTTGSVTVSVTETLIASSTTKTVTATACTYVYRWFYGVDSHSGGNAITASTTNATLSGGSATATLTGVLSSASVIGQSFAVAPASSYVYVALPHTASPHVFHDQLGNIFDVNTSPVVTSYSYTNVQGQAGILMDIYRSANLLNASYTVTIVSMLSRHPRPRWLDLPATNDVVPDSEAA